MATFLLILNMMAMMVVTKIMIARPLMSLQNDDDVIE